jgi:hypothetical protein
MPNLYPSLEAGEADSSSSMTECVSVTGALKVVTPFNGDKREVLAFIANVDTAFEVTDPRNADTLYKFVLTRISGNRERRLSTEIWENGKSLNSF